MNVEEEVENKSREHFGYKEDIYLFGSNGF